MTKPQHKAGIYHQAVHYYIVIPGVGATGPAPERELAITRYPKEKRSVCVLFSFELMLSDLICLHETDGASLLLSTTYYTPLLV